MLLLFPRTHFQNLFCLFLCLQLRLSLWSGPHSRTPICFLIRGVRGFTSYLTDFCKIRSKRAEDEHGDFSAAWSHRGSGAVGHREITSVTRFPADLCGLGVVCSGAQHYAVHVSAARGTVGLRALLPSTTFLSNTAVLGEGGQSTKPRGHWRAVDSQACPPGSPGQGVH